jgi:hypothetical protein
MKIDLDRLCRLAGLEKGSAESLNEASNRSYHDDPALDAERKIQYANQLNETDEDDDKAAAELKEIEDAMEMYTEESDDAEPPMDSHPEEGADETAMVSEDVDLDEVIEIDEAMLVQELRRARAMISEAKKTEISEEESEELTEAQLRQLVADEVAGAMKDFNLTSGWIYGEKKPKSAMKGYVHQGSFLKGIGFEK